MQPQNLLFIMSDEHSANAMGAAGHPVAKTPNLDALAARGTLFSAAYTPSPICVPARAAFATGRHVHEIGAWDNGHPYDGSVPGWGHALQAAGRPVLSIGKLHYRGEADPTGFDTQIRPMHVVDGKGDVYGAIKDPMPVRFGGAKFSREIGPGESGYTRYDRAIADEAVRWLGEEAPAAEGPWVLFVSFVCPHFPLIAPEPFFALYDPAAMKLPKDYRLRPRHPWIEAYAEAQPYDSFFNDEARRMAIASYYGLCSFLDDNIGRVLAALDEAGLAGATRVIYTSDHGENLGARGLWGKSNMYEEAVRVPLIAAGPGVPAGRVCGTPATLLDCHPAILEGAGLGADPALPGRSLWTLGEEPERAVFSEYHAAGATSGCFMLRQGRWKLIRYTGFEPELFDLEADPEERWNLAAEEPRTVARLTAAMREVCDPDEVHRRARASQNALVEAHGGRTAVMRAGAFSGTPAPGDKPVFTA